MTGILVQVFRRNAEDLQALLADKMYSWSNLREACRDASTRPVIKHCEQNALKKAHNARIDDEVYNQRSMSETVFAMLKDDGDGAAHYWDSYEFAVAVAAADGEAETIELAATLRDAFVMVQVHASAAEASDPTWLVD